MCGILGFITHKNNSEKYFSETVSFIQSRGPDDQGKYEIQNRHWKIAFHHTRLAILDLSKNGHQPMEDLNSAWIILYNGEIYNFLELQKHLTALGFYFTSHSDTEVLLKMWIQWGLKGIYHLNGMFAFSVFNKKTNELWLVRDRFGVKPLHWGFSQKNKSFFYSSSLAAVAKCLQASVNLNACAVGLHSLAYEYDSESTAFQSVHSVKPGGWLKVKLQNDDLIFSQGIWYDLDQEIKSKCAEARQTKSDDLLKKTQELLSDSVKLRMRSDAPVAVSLSSGLDSSIISAIASKMNKQLNSFTYGSISEKKSEGPLVQRISNSLGLVPHFVWPKNDEAYLDNLFERTLAAQEAPFSGLSVMAQNEVFYNVRNFGFKVVLGGQGGDEIFAGYRKFFLVALRQSIYEKKPLKILSSFYSLVCVTISELSSIQSYIQNMQRYKKSFNNSFYLLNWEKPKLDLLGPYRQTLTDRQVQDIKKWSIPTLLRYEDRNSMAFGVESRLPFMDYRLVEVALSLPEHLKLNNGYGKWALRKTTEQIIPKYIANNRKKRGFDVTQTWISHGLGNKIRERIKSNPTKLSSFLKKGINLDLALSDKCLSGNQRLLDEAIMLCWLIEPIRNKIIKN